MIPKPIIIDISEWQKPAAIDYPQLAKVIDGAIVRIQYGSNYIDKHYWTHLQRLKEQGIPIAVYAWVRGTSLADMAREATDFYQRGKIFDPKFWWLDVEEQSMTDMRGGCEVYRQTLKALGAKKVGAYIANHLYKDFNLDTAKFDGIWLPAYGKNNGLYYGADPTAAKDYDIHQYTSKGRLPGYHTSLDLNRFTSDRSFEYFFGEKTTSKGGLVRMKEFTLKKESVLRKSPQQQGQAIATLKVGEIVVFDDILSKEGLIWGIQPRADGSKGYLPLGQLAGSGEIK